jgi:hypothetical protein
MSFPRSNDAEGSSPGGAAAARDLEAFPELHRNALYIRWLYGEFVIYFDTKTERSRFIKSFSDQWAEWEER